MNFIVNYMTWKPSEGRWSGVCPRCNHKTYFELKSTINGKPYTAEVLYCPDGHSILVEYTPGDLSKKIVTCCPVDYSVNIPSWLPKTHIPVYKELLEARSKGYKRSVVALCAILLEAHVNEKLKNPGEKKKSLFDRLNILKTQGAIDTDQFSQGTITRLTRNEVLHPDEILAEISDKDTEEVFNEVTSFFERSYKWRSSRALPSPKEEITDDESQDN